MTLPILCIYHGVYSLPTYSVVSGWPHCCKGAADAAPPFQLAVTLSVLYRVCVVFETFNKKVLNQTVIAKAQLSQVATSSGSDHGCCLRSNETIFPGQGEHFSLSGTAESILRRKRSR